MIEYSVEAWRMLVMKSTALFAPPMMVGSKSFVDMGFPST